MRTFGKTVIGTTYFLRDVFPDTSVITGENIAPANSR
jgi:hypothetical protein